MSESSSSGKRPILVHLSIILATLIVVSGCVVGPHYKRPDASVPQAYKEVPPGWKAAAPGDQIPRGKWWEIFHDPQLNTLEERVNVSNQTLKAADAHDREPRATLEASMAKLFASEAAHRAADKAMQILASHGYRRGSVVERLFRDVRAAEIYQGTSEVQRMVIAEQILG